MEGLLAWMDEAALVVCYNGHAFDMRVLTRHYDGDEERQERHARKLLDPMLATTRAAGRRLRLSHLLSINGQRGKAGAGCDAPGLWHEGKLDALERYCMRDVEALAELALRDTVRVPGGATREATVWHALSRRPAEGGSSSGDTPLRDTNTRAAREDTTETPGAAARRPRSSERRPRAPGGTGDGERDVAANRTGNRTGPETTENKTATPPRLGFQKEIRAETLSIEELIEALDKVGMRTHTSKDAMTTGMS